MNRPLASSFDFHKIMLRCCGFWAPKSTDRQTKANYLIIRIIILSLFLFIYIGLEIVNLFKVWPNVDEITKTSLLLFPHFSIWVKARVFIFKIKRIRKLLVMLNTFKPSVLTEPTYKEVSMIVKIYSAVASFTVVLYATFPIVNARITGQMKLPFGVWFPFNYYKPNLFEIIVIYQCLVTLYAGLMSIGVDTFVTGMIAYSCVQIEVLKSSLENIGSDTCKELAVITVNSKWNEFFDGGLKFSLKDIELFQKRVLEKLHSYIIHHEQILRFTEETRSLFHLGIFVQVAMSVIAICCCSFQMIATDQSSIFSGEFQSNLGYLICALFQVLIFCLYANRLASCSESISTSIYSSNWYRPEYSLRFKKEMLLFMMKVGRPIRFKAGNVLTLSLQMFVTILKTSYTYLTLLQKMNSN